MDSGRTQPVLLGGLFIGVLSALPFVGFANCCCCMWVLSGGVLATYLRQQRLPEAITPAEGALVGLLAGLVGGVIWGLLSIPVDMLFGDWIRQMAANLVASNPDVPREVVEMLEMSQSTGMRIFNVVSVVVAGAVFGLLGGLLGVVIFKKNSPPLPPPTVIPHDPGVAQ